MQTRCRLRRRARLLLVLRCVLHITTAHALGWDYPTSNLSGDSLDTRRTFGDG